MKSIGIGLAVIGGIMFAIGFIWGWIVGYYPSELPAVVVLVGGGALLAFIGSKMMGSESRSPSKARVAAGYPGTRSTGANVQNSSYVAQVLGAPAPTVTPATVSAAPDGIPAVDRVPASATAERLAELAAAHPDLWDEIAAHPNAYDELRTWIATERGSASPAPAAGDLSEPATDVAARRASDPTTTPAQLAVLAQQHPELRAAIAANPSAYPALREWIARAGGG